MRFRLRTLLILLAIAPPLLAILWAYRDPLLDNRFGTLTMPDGLTLASEEKLREQLAIDLAWHAAAGGAAVLFFALTVLFVCGVFASTRSWQEPQTNSPYAWAATVCSVLLVLFGSAFAFTTPTLPKLGPKDFNRFGDYTRYETAYHPKYELQYKP